MMERRLIEFMKNVTKDKYDLETMGKVSLKIIKDYTPEKSSEIIKTAIFSIMLIK